MHRDAYLGQAFNCLVSVHNDSNDVITEVVVKVDLQAPASRATLAQHQLARHAISHTCARYPTAVCLS